MASPRVGAAGPRGLSPPPPPPLPLPLPLLLLLLLLRAWPAAAHGGKYSREKNEPGPAPTRAPGEEFRMEKLSQLWGKAQRLGLSPVRLAELHADLRMQERDEFAWKKLKLEGLDGDGEKEAALRRNLAVLTAKYGLDGRKGGRPDAREHSPNALGDGAQEDGLGDPRLEKLWHKATTSGKFSREDLDKLWREMQHHKEKLREYNELLDALSRSEDAHENAIGPAPAAREPPQDRHVELKGRLRALHLGYDRLRRVSHLGYGDQPAEFEEPRVTELWDLARAANFSEQELESLREELRHFEVKLEKHEHYQRQLELSHQKLRHVERLGDGEHLGRSRERHALLQERTKELGYKVKKHLQDLSSRISRARHNEL